MGLTVIDAGVVIGLLAPEDAHHRAARQALEATRSRGDRMIVPASALAEILVGPSRTGDKDVATVRRLIGRVPLEIAPLDVDVAVHAAALRAGDRSLKLPDALVLATARHLDADRLITTDRRWPSQDSLGLTTEITVI